MFYEYIVMHSIVYTDIKLIQVLEKEDSRIHACMHSSIHAFMQREMVRYDGVSCPIEYIFIYILTLSTNSDKISKRERERKKRATMS